MPKPAQSRLCSTLEFARQRGISRQRVLALLDAGRIAGAQWIGTRWAIPRAARIAPPGRTQPLRRGQRMRLPAMDKPTRSRVVLKLEQMDSKLKSFLANFQARNPRECASNMYFAALHAAESLLYAKGIEAASHKAVASLLAMHFVRPGTLPRETSAKFSALMAGRHDADYNEAIPFGPEDARAAAATGHVLLADLLRALDEAAGAPPTARARKLLARIAKAVPRRRARS